MIDRKAGNPTSSGRGVSILVMSNTEEELRTAQEQLSKDHGVVRYTDKEADFIRIFNEESPRLLILAFSEIPMAERAYLLMYRQCHKIHGGTHLTLLLCKSSEAESAHGLCVSGTFDDYMVNRPLHDPHRVDWSVRQLLARCDVMRESTGLNQRLSAVGSDLRRLDEYVSPSLRRGTASHEDSIRAVHELSGKLQGHLDRFHDRLSDPSQSHAIKVVDPEALRHQIHLLRQESLEPEIQAVAGKMETAANMSRELEDGFQSRVARLKSTPFPAPIPEVLLIDDDNIYREIVTEILESADIRVFAAEDGPTGLSELKYHRPNVILLDHLMPEMDGLEVLRKIKHDPELRNVPVIMLTGMSEKHVVKDCLVAGAAGFIVKPSDRKTILEKVSACFPKDI